MVDCELSFARRTGESWIDLLQLHETAGNGSEGSSALADHL